MGVNEFAGRAHRGFMSLMIKFIVFSVIVLFILSFLYGVLDGRESDDATDPGQPPAVEEIEPDADISE